MNFDALILLARQTALLLPSSSGVQEVTKVAESVLALLQTFRNTPGGEILAMPLLLLQEAVEAHSTETEKRLRDAASE